MYPRLPEAHMLDFHALMPSDGSNVQLKFLELLDSVIAILKSTFNKLSTQTMLAYRSGNLNQGGGGLVADLVERNAEVTGELQG